MGDRAAGDFLEVGDRCFVRRYPEWDVSVGVIVGAAGVLVLDTRASARQGAQLRDDVRRLAPHAEIRWVVNTHQHFDHTFGNVAFAAGAIYAHENAARGLEVTAARIKRLIRADPELDPDRPEITADVLADVLDTELRPPDHTFSSAATIDLGDRYVELVYPGRGHTDGDLLLTVPDVDVVFAGDLIEQSAPPGFGSDCFPLEWAGSLDLLIGLLSERSVVIPGHGSAVDKTFVSDQRTDIGDLAEMVRSLFAQGVPVSEALQVGAQASRPAPLAQIDAAAISAPRGWPFPRDGLQQAVERGYAHLRA